MSWYKQEDLKLDQKIFYFFVNLGEFLNSELIFLDFLLKLFLSVFGM